MLKLTQENKVKKISNIMDALSSHEDPASIKVLEEYGTNSSLDEIREMSARALIRKNSHESLKLMILNKGKGINDLSAKVAMTAINELLALQDKTEAIKILEDTIQMHDDKDVKDTARSVRALMSYSN